MTIISNIIIKLPSWGESLSLSQKLRDWFESSGVCRSISIVSIKTAIQMMAVFKCSIRKTKALANLSFEYFSNLKKGRQEAKFRSFCFVVLDQADWARINLELQMMRRALGICQSSSVLQNAKGLSAEQIWRWRRLAREPT